MKTFKRGRFICASNCIEKYFIYYYNCNYYLFSAIINNNIEIVKILLKYGASINICNREFQTPILLACSEISPSKDLSEIIKLLIKAVADLQIKNLQMKTVIHILVERQNIDMLSYIISVILGN